MDEFPVPEVPPRIEQASMPPPPIPVTHEVFQRHEYPSPPQPWCPHPPQYLQQLPQHPPPSSNPYRSSSMTSLAHSVYSWSPSDRSATSEPRDSPIQMSVESGATPQPQSTPQSRNSKKQSQTSENPLPKCTGVRLSRNEETELFRICYGRKDMYKTGKRGRNDGLTNFWANVCVDFEQAIERGYTPESCKRVIDKYEGKRKVQILANDEVVTGKTQDDWEMALDDWCNFKIEYEKAENNKDLTAEEVNKAAHKAKRVQKNMMRTFQKKKDPESYTDSEDEQEKRFNSDSEDDVDNSLWMPSSTANLEVSSTTAAAESSRSRSRQETSRESSVSSRNQPTQRGGRQRARVRGSTSSTVVGEDSAPIDRLADVITKHLERRDDSQQRLDQMEAMLQGQSQNLERLMAAVQQVISVQKEQ